MAGTGKKAVRRTMAVLCIAFAELTRVLPLPIARGLGRILGRTAYLLIPRIRRAGRANLDAAYGDTLSPAEKRQILRHVVENAGIVGAEFSRIPKIPHMLKNGTITVEGIEHFDRSKGIMFVGAHIGNWEWMGPMLTAIGFNAVGVVRPLGDALLNQYVSRMRQSLGTLNLDKATAGAEVLRLLKEGWLSGILVDQSPTNSAVPVTFFGQPCWATIAPVMVALRARIPAHPVCMIRQPGGRYRFIIGPPIPFTRTRDLHADMVQNSQRVQDAIEAIVRAHPGQWLWLHRRWKPRPRLEQEWQARIAKTKPRA